MIFSCKKRDVIMQVSVGTTLMEESRTTFVQNDCCSHLSAIDGVKFTHREIDIIACFLCGRSRKTTASFLSISPRTVEAHTRSIMLKLECNSRENIIDFIEKSPELPLIRLHYRHLLTEVNFKKCLKEISKLIQNKRSIVKIFFGSGQSEQANLVCEYLNLAGIKVSSEILQNFEIGQMADFILYILPEKHNLQKEWINQLEKVIQKGIHCSDRIILLLPKNSNEEIHPKIKEISYIDFSKQENYYFAVFEILRKILPNVDLEKSLGEFKKQCEIINLVPGKEPPGAPSRVDEILQRGSSLRSTFGSNKWQIVILSVIGMLILLVFSYSYINHSDTHSTIVNSNKIRVVRSDLPLPHESVLLKRPFEIKEMEDRFKGSKGIQTVVLAGIGGSGKTTLSRLYARSQKTSVVWIIDAETKASFINSFEKLAYALSEVEEEKRELKEILGIKKEEERDEKLIFFLKGKLKSHSHWFLIYDNVEVLNNVLNFFPLDPEVWGDGKIIITTRDGNIKNNQYINRNNVINIKELSAEEKFILFMKILYGNIHQNLEPTQKEQIESFLKEIPPFPLDISTAALYIKDTKISYPEYLERVKVANRDFDREQEFLLKVEGDYIKTRYGIVATTLQRILEEYPDFKDLLLFISMLDSQNIPRDLLNAHRNDAGQFIRTLKKHSFILNEENELNLSLHRSIQAISLSYLVKALNLKKGDPLIESIALTLENYMLDSSDKEDSLTMNLLVEHAEKFLKQDKLLVEPIKGCISSKLGCIYSYQGLYSEPKELLEKSLAVLNGDKNKNHAAIARCLYCLANAYWNGGHFQEAQITARKAFNTYKNHFPDNNRIAQALRMIANTYRAIGNYEEAQSYFEQSLNLYKRTDPQNHLGIATVFSLLGHCYYDLGFYEKAQNLLEQSLEIYKKNPKSYYGYSRALTIHGMISRKLGHYEKAKELLMQAHTINMESMFDHSYIAAWTLGCLGNVYRDLGDYTEAKKLMKQCFEVFMSNWGENNFMTASWLSDLGYVYLLEGRLEEAEKFFKDSLQRFERNRHVSIYIALENMANLYSKKYEQAVIKKDNHETLIFKEQAIDYLKKALETVRAGFPQDSPHIARLEAKLRSIN